MKNIKKHRRNKACGRIELANSLWHAVRILYPQTCRLKEHTEISFRSVPSVTETRRTSNKELQLSEQGSDDTSYITQSPRDFLRGRLVCFLPGQVRTPSNYKRLIFNASVLGYHALRISVGDNNESVFSGHSCYLSEERMHKALNEQFVSLLNHLIAQHPEEGWDYYLEDGEVLWRRIALVAPQHDRTNQISQYFRGRKSSSAPASWLRYRRAEIGV